MMSVGQTRSEQILERTKQFAVRVVRMYSTLPATTLAQTLGKQALQSGTSVGANCREGRRARSRAEFVSKLQVAIQELDETAYWFELFVECEVVPLSKLAALIQEADELTAILTSVIKRSKAR